MKALIAAVVITAFGALAWFMLPTPPRPEPGPPSGGHAGHAGDPAAVSEGVVLSVDGAARSVTINHGPLRNLGMPPMTMEFQIADPAMLDRLKTGDRVKFHADAAGGAFTATGIEIAN